MKAVVSLFLAAALLPVTTVSAQGTSAVTDAGSAATKPVKPARKICRSDTRSDTRLTKRICKTQEEWDADAVDPRAQLLDASNALRRN